MFTDKLMPKLQKTHLQINQITGPGKGRCIERRATGKASRHGPALESSHPRVFLLARKGDPGPAALGWLESEGH